MLGEVVDVIVDDGASPGGEASTIVDVTGTQGRVLRLGALSLEQLNAVLEPLGATLVLEDGAPDADPDADPDTDQDTDQDTGPDSDQEKDSDEGGA